MAFFPRHAADVQDPIFAAQYDIVHVTSASAFRAAICSPGSPTHDQLMSVLVGYLSTLRWGS